MPWTERLVYQVSICLLSDQKREEHADWRRQRAQRPLLNGNISGWTRDSTRLLWLEQNGEKTGEGPEAGECLAVESMNTARWEVTGYT